ncbi:uncharacterized protein BT62DRAFT_1009495 [Guyanagaster necrorhizus]|uniref:Uncharacterized protein n=1 Tax=Guyanagaster necrorhizus TaxID=856835 RepID=A0A9P8AQX5_9AGAR|nr:uncharacterized protein BT62DRAFT_1009495 [Guyanagaster necrorhizus MCA 3950]KAG7443287.1 hypothetical protein BT62DRAFT_1009495 [Guyanagaster necrorhizus MCA 3950]
MCVCTFNERGTDIAPTLWLASLPLFCNSLTLQPWIESSHREVLCAQPIRSPKMFGERSGPRGSRDAASCSSYAATISFKRLYALPDGKFARAGSLNVSLRPRPRGRRNWESSVLTTGGPSSMDSGMTELALDRPIAVLTTNHESTVLDGTLTVFDDRAPEYKMNLLI